MYVGLKSQKIPKKQAALGQASGESWRQNRSQEVYSTCANMLVMAKILIVDDQNELCDVVAEILTDQKHSPCIALTEQTAFLQLKRHIIDLVLVDVCLSAGNQEGFNILEYCTTNLPHMPVIVMSGHASVESAVECVNRGAVDFIEKPFSKYRLIQSIEQHLANAENNRLFQRLSDHDLEVIAHSPAMKDTMNKLHSCMSMKPYITLLGRQGTGKNTLAQYIHRKTAARQSRFYTIDFSKVTTKQDAAEQLVGSANNGLLFQSVGGTLVFDKLDMATQEVQAYLLSLVSQLDSTKMKFKIISLMQSTAYHTGFNSQLYTKLSSLLLNVPELKDRKEDFAGLVKELCRPYKPNITDAMVDILKAHTWPGNLYELKAVLQQMLIKNPDELDPKNLNWQVNGLNDPSVLQLPYKEAVHSFTKNYFTGLLNLSGGNQTLAAQRAGVDRSTLHRKLTRREC